MDTLQDAFNKLYERATKVLDSDIELSEEDNNIVMTELWSILRKVKPFYTGEDLEE